jgi:hypothetical protein
MKPASVLKAAQLIKTGEYVELGHVLSQSMPISGTRQFNAHTKRTFMNKPSNRRGSNEELLTSEIGQVGTQFDGFAHQTIVDRSITATSSTTSPLAPGSRRWASRRWEP